jgi:hypothetical protein
MELVEYIVELGKAQRPLTPTEQGRQGTMFMEGISQGRTESGYVMVTANGCGTMMCSTVDDAQYTAGAAVMLARTESGKVICLGEIH